MTGRGAGYCADYTMPGFMNPMPGRGRGMGRGGRNGGRGRHGWRHRACATELSLRERDDIPGIVALGPEPTPAEELQTLNNQVGHLEQTLEQLRRRIAELETV